MWLCSAILYEFNHRQHWRKRHALEESEVVVDCFISEALRVAFHYQALMQVLFFTRLFGDITGRTIPRQKSLAMRSQRWLLIITVVLAATLPLFFVYIKYSWHSDLLSTGRAFATSMWLHTFIKILNRRKVCNQMLQQHSHGSYEHAHWNDTKLQIWMEDRLVFFFVSTRCP